jgi:Na+/H+-dicarboxylate symporter
MQRVLLLIAKLLALRQPSRLLRKALKACLTMSSKASNSATLHQQPCIHVVRKKASAADRILSLVPHA